MNVKAMKQGRGVYHVVACGAILLFIRCAGAPDAQVNQSETASREALAAGATTLTLNKSSAFCLDVRGAGTNNGTAVQIYRCNASGAQNWLQNNNTLRAFGKCLTVTDNVASGGKLILNDCVEGLDSQQFVITGSAVTMLRHNFCLDVTDGLVANNTQLQVWACNVANTNQQWTPHSVPGRDSNPKASPCKRGIAYGGHSPADLRALAPGISWWYNWADSPESAVADEHKALKVDYVPMIWGGAFDDQNLLAHISGSYLLAFNEPNFNSQANLTPVQAAALWPRIEAIARARNLKIVSPAVNYCGGGCNETSPYDWLDQFFAACPNCQVDYIAFHWYACSKDALTYELNQFESRYKRPLWLTEFSCLDSGAVTDAAQSQYMSDAVSILERDPNVFRYAWFTGRMGASNSNLLAADGQLTALGSAYVSAPQSCRR